MFQRVGESVWEVESGVRNLESLPLDMWKCLDSSLLIFAPHIVSNTCIQLDDSSLAHTRPFPYECEGSEDVLLAVPCYRAQSPQKKHAEPNMRNTILLVYTMLRNKRAAEGHHTSWTPHELHDDPAEFVAEIRASLPLRPSIAMLLLFVTPKGSSQTVGGPIMSVRRRYTMHCRCGTKSTVSFTKHPFDTLYAGVFFSRAEATDYGELMRTQGLSFSVEGVAGAKQCLASEVERAREIGDTLAVHTSLLPLALLSGVGDDFVTASLAAVDAARVIRSAAARHRSLGNLCDCLRHILENLVVWAQGTDPILKWEEGTEADGEREIEDDEPDSGRWNTKKRCRSARDLFQTWLRTAHLLFWGWRCDVLRYLDADLHSDVAVVKDKVRRWIEEASSTARMGLDVPVLRWHDHGRTVAEGKGAFVEAASNVGERLDSLSGWLHCLDLSLAWDAAKVCDEVHILHTRIHDTASDGGGSGDHWQKFIGYKQAGQKRGISADTPTAVGLLAMQRSWLDGAAVAAMGKAHSRGPHKRGKGPGASKNAAAAAREGCFAPAPVAPDSTKASKGVDVRLAVLETLHEDLVPEAFAHEMTLMRYATDHGIDESVNNCVRELVTNVLMPNPYPTLTDALALRSMAHLLSRTVDSAELVQSPKLALWKQGRVSERSSEQDIHKTIFVARGEEEGAFAFGTKAALEGIDVDAILMLFDILPPVASWVLDVSGQTTEDDSVDVGICRRGEQNGPNAHHTVPSEITAVVACSFRYDVSTGTPPLARFARRVVHCAVAVHKKSPHCVVGLIAKTTSDANSATPQATEALSESKVSLRRLLSAREDVEDELTELAPNEIVLRMLVQHPISEEQEVFVPLSIRFLFTSDVARGGGCDETSVATLLYDCVYSAGFAAKTASSRHSALSESGLAERYLEHTGRLALEKVDRMEYLEAYRLLLRRRNLRLVLPEDESGTGPHDPTEEVDRPNGDHPGSMPNTRSATSADTAHDKVIAEAIARMLRGPAGRLHHARQMLDVLRNVLTGKDMEPEAMAQLEGSAVKDHAEYSIYYLLDTLAEQPLVRFEGAVESVKLRARLLCDRVRDMAVLEESAAEAVGAEATREICKLAESVITLLETVQLAVEFDTHRCCPEVHLVFERLRVEEKARKKQNEADNEQARKGIRRLPSSRKARSRGVGLGRATADARVEDSQSKARAGRHGNSGEETPPLKLGAAGGVRRRQRSSALTGDKP